MPETPPEGGVQGALNKEPAGHIHLRKVEMKPSGSHWNPSRAWLYQEHSVHKNNVQNRKSADHFARVLRALRSGPSSCWQCAPSSCQVVRGYLPQLHDLHTWPSGTCQLKAWWDSFFSLMACLTSGVYHWFWGCNHDWYVRPYSHCSEEKTCCLLHCNDCWQRYFMSVSGKLAFLSTDQDAEEQVRV